MNNITYTLNLDGKDSQITCMCCAYFLSYQEEYRSHLDPHDHGSCHNPDVADKSLRFGAYMTCSLQKMIPTQPVRFTILETGDSTRNTS